MKQQFDKNAVQCSFQPWNSVLALLPIAGLVLHARFAGPYDVEKKLSDTDYVICTPDRKCRSCVCHVNMLKSYAAQYQDVQKSSNEVRCVAPVSVVSTCSVDDGLTKENVPALCAWLQSSQVLANLETPASISF